MYKDIGSKYKRAGSGYNKMALHCFSSTYNFVIESRIRQLGSKIDKLGRITQIKKKLINVSVNHLCIFQRP